MKFHASAGMEPTPSCLPGKRLDHYATKEGDYALLKSRHYASNMRQAFCGPLMLMCGGKSFRLLVSQTV
ncbi:hypothetical protein M8J77_011912 [Diaphorina citri]|nr:hypothetical protein M8J77_011912 [Diaphorina citri]